MPSDQVKLNLHQAPLVVSSKLIDAQSNLEITWPKTFNYVIPSGINNTTKVKYIEKLDWIKRHYSLLMSQKQTRTIAPHVLPYAARVDIKISTSNHTLANNLWLFDEIPTEYTQSLTKTLQNSLKLKPPKPQKIDYANITGFIASNKSKVKVVNAQPLNELEAGVNLLYQNIYVSWQQTFNIWKEIKYQHKLDYLYKSLSLNNIKNFSYDMEFVVEPHIFQLALQAGLFSDAVVQNPTPTLGYDIPDNLRDGGMIERCFDLSYELYGLLQKDTPYAAQLACLYGHRQRFLAHLSWSEVLVAYSLNSKPLKPFLNRIKTAMSEKHPLIHEYLRDNLVQR
jgi:hypothetical protein